MRINSIIPKEIDVESKKIAIIGSMKCYDIQREIVLYLTLSGAVPFTPISVGDLFEQYPDDFKRETVKKILDSHIRKVIDSSDIIYVVNPYGYIGESTKGEIDYATAMYPDKPIIYLNRLSNDDGQEIMNYYEIYDFVCSPTNDDVQIKYFKAGIYGISISDAKKRVDIIQKDPDLLKQRTEYDMIIDFIKGEVSW